ncbi:MAG: cytochrome-c peroxidase, partial [Acidobacteriaceae bacterium]
LGKTLQFYMERDTDPKKWYPVGPDGTVKKFDDLPAKYHNNVDIVDLPFGRTLGEKPIWNQQQIDDVIAFLKTLDDQDVAANQIPTR